MPKSSNQKKKLLYLLDMLREHTDEKHVLTTKEIIERLAANGISAERKSIYDDIRALQDYGYDILQTDSRNGKIPTAYSLHNENEIVRRAQQYISNNLRSKLSVPIVAAGIDISPSYLTALFHKHLQIAPAEYIRRTKLQESKQMIRENTMNFTEIATVLQYSTVHHFSRQFKEHFGITPSEYAKSVR